MSEKKIVEYEITPEGSLGLLALGAVGLRAWRELKKAHEAKTEKTKEEDGKKNS